MAKGKKKAASTKPSKKSNKSSSGSSSQSSGGIFDWTRAEFGGNQDSYTLDPTGSRFSDDVTIMTDNIWDSLCPYGGSVWG